MEWYVCAVCNLCIIIIVVAFELSVEHRLEVYGLCAGSVSMWIYGMHKL